MATRADYTADQIVVLEGLEPVRVRPGMYIGSTGSRGLHHLLWEIVDNAVDEALAGHCSEIFVSVDESGVVTVADNGRGIPVDLHASGESALDLVFTRLHAGGKFGGGGYKVAGGLHGVGASVTNALSEWLEVEVRRDGGQFRARYERGVPVGTVTRVAEVPDGESGTTVRFRFDERIFDEDARYSATTIEQRLREKSYLVRGLAFRFAWPGRDEQRYSSQRGLADYVRALNSEREPVHSSVVHLVHAGSSDDPSDIAIEVALQWTQSAEEHLYAFANVVPTPEGGTHASGLRRALTRTLNALNADAPRARRDRADAFEGRDVVEGLTAAITVCMEDPQFEGQTKQKLNNADVMPTVASFVSSAFAAWLNDPAHAKDGRAILERVRLAQEIRVARGRVSRKLRNAATSIFNDSNLPGKLADCQELRPVAERELFVVEGDSAAGSAKAARDAVFQAILPIRGKILNVLGARNGRVFENTEIEGILTALGGRKDLIGKQVVATLEPDQLRYGRVIVLSDADVDGAHIANLLLTLFAEVFPQLLQQGRVFLAQPPLFKVNLDARGDRVAYAHSDAERAALVKRHRRSGADVTRFKGLGEMNAEHLAETCFAPETRKLLQVTVQDLAAAHETLNLIMGSRPEPRRAWLEDVGLRTDQ